jgi:hypothetical protein
LAVQLGAGASTSTSLNIFRWSSVTATPTAYITYTGAGLGLTYGPRAAGINIQGSLSGNAIITVPMAQKQDVLVWTVVNGALTSTTPAKLTFPYSGTSYYYGIQSISSASTASGFVGAGTGTNFNGIISLTSTMSEVSKQTGIVTTDCDVYTYNGRIYMAYTAYVSGSGARFRVCDITDGSSNSYKNPIMDLLMPSTAANANTTVDADLAIINGKLCAAFICSNIGARIYQLEK